MCEQCVLKTLACHSFCKDSLANLQNGTTKKVDNEDANSVSSGTEKKDALGEKDVLCINQQSIPIAEKFDADRHPEIKADKSLEVKEDCFIFISDQCDVHDLLQQDDYYCGDCNTVACLECVNEMHASHKCDKVSTILAETLSQLRSSVQPACECASRANTSLQQLAQDNESIESNRNVCKESIANMFNKIRKTVDEREELILTNLDSYIDWKLHQVEIQKRSIEEVEDQLQQCVKEINKVLGSTSVDVNVLINKQLLINRIEVQKQRILDIEDRLQRFKFSSKYIGFHDNSHTFQAKLDELIVMCEYYPDADSGYYSSRNISLETKENLCVETRPRCKLQSLPNISESTSNTSYDQHYFVEGRGVSNGETETASLKRSVSTPIGTTRPKWLTTKRMSGRVTNSYGPMIPIRFDSLQIPTPIRKPLSIFDKLSTLKNEVVHPCGICVGENNSIIITDVRHHCLRIISSNGRSIGDIGKEGKRLALFEDPCAVVMNDKAQIFVCQRDNPRIQRLTSAGKCMKKLWHKSFGEPWAMVVAHDGKLYVTDWDRSCIHIFQSNGDYNVSIGGDDSLLGESLKFPAGIAMNAEGQLIVADRGNHCLWLLETNGQILRRIGSKGHKAGELYYPYGVAVHQNGSIVVSESGNNRISVFSPRGKFLSHFGQRGSEPGMFEHPRHVCVTSKGEVIVADELNHRLQLFEI